MGFTRRFAWSLAGPKRYPALVADGLRPAIGYLFLLILLPVIAFGVRDYSRVGSFLRRSAADVRTWPAFALRDGRFSCSGSMPFENTFAGIRIIIDTTGKTGPEALGSTEQGCLLTSDCLFVRNAGSTMPLRWADLPLETDRDRFADLLPGLFWPLYVIVLIALLVGNILRFALMSLLVTFVGWGAVGVRSMAFGRALTVGIYASTWPLIVTLLRGLLLPELPLIDYFCYALAVAWAALAMYAVRRKGSLSDGPPGAGG